MTRSALERTALSVPITSSARRLKVSTRVTWVLTTGPVGLTSGNGRGRRIARRARCRDRTRRGALKRARAKRLENRSFGGHGAKYGEATESEALA